MWCTHSSGTKSQGSPVSFPDVLGNVAKKTETEENTECNPDPQSRHITVRCINSRDQGVTVFLQSIDLLLGELP